MSWLYRPLGHILCGYFYYLFLSSGPGCAQVGFVNSFYFVGMAAGGTLFGAFSDRYGRRTALYTCTALAATLSALSASTAGFWPHFVWRTLSAMAVQGMATSDVVLVTEPVGASYRGRVGTVTQVAEAFGGTSNQW